MHPIEHLRFLARADDAPPSWLVPEAAEALRGLVGDRNALVMGSRKLLEHLPLCGPMWWLCGQVLVARDPRTALDELVDTFDRDPTMLQLSLALSDVPLLGDGAPRILEAVMVGGAGVVVTGPKAAPVGDGDLTDGDPAIWVIAGIGTVVPDEIFVAATRRAQLSQPHQGIRRPTFRVVPIEAVERVIRPSGAGGSELVRTRPDVPFVPELLRRG